MSRSDNACYVDQLTILGLSSGVRSDCYGETVKVGFLEVSTVEVIKDQDPISWDIAKSEYIDGLVEDEQLITFDNGSTLYWVHDVENFIEQNLEMEEAC